MINKKKINSIAVLIENIEYGGTTTHLINLINSEKFRNKKFIIITNKGNKAVKNILSSCKKRRIKILYYTSLFFPFFSIKLFKLSHYFLKPLLFPISIFQMHQILKKIKYDLLLANFGGYGDFRSELSGVIASKILNRKNLFLLIHHCYTKPFFWNNLINKFISLFIGSFAKGIIFVSNATKNNIMKNTYLLKNSKGKMKVIHNGVNTNIANQKPLKIFNTNSKIKVLMLSRLEKYKGHEDFVYAFSKLPERIQIKYKIFFVGRGDPFFVRRLKNKIINLKLKENFKFFNYLNFESIRIFKSVNVFFSLTRDFEGFGYSIAESLLAKTPVISTKVGGVVEFLNKDNSELIEPRDTKKITQILIKFIKKRNYFKKKAIKGKLLIQKKFNSNVMGENFYKFFLQSS